MSSRPVFVLMTQCRGCQGSVFCRYYWNRVSTYMFPGSTAAFISFTYQVIYLFFVFFRDDLDLYICRDGHGEQQLHCLRFYYFRLLRRQFEGQGILTVKRGKKVPERNFPYMAYKGGSSINMKAKKSRVYGSGYSSLPSYVLVFGLGFFCCRRRRSTRQAWHLVYRPN